MSRSAKLVARALSEAEGRRAMPITIEQAAKWLAAFNLGDGSFPAGLGSGVDIDRFFASKESDPDVNAAYEMALDQLQQNDPDAVGLVFQSGFTFPEYH